MATTTAEQKASGALAAIRGRLRFRLSARGRILAWWVALLILAAVGGLLLQRQRLLENLDEEVDEGLAQQVQELRRLASTNDPETAQPFGDNVEAIFDTFVAANFPAEGDALVMFVNGEHYKSTVAPYQLEQNDELVERWSRLTSLERGEVDSPAGPVRYVAMPIEYEGEVVGVFVAANFLDEQRDEVAEALRAGGMAWISLIAVAIVAAWIVAGRVLAPVRVLSDTAKQISETDLSRRIPIQGSDELTDLTVVFNGMLDRLEYAFSAQRSFLDDAGHELRTPITVIRGHLELISDDPRERRETVALVTDELDRMTRIVDDLLLLARAEQRDFLLPAAVDLDIFTTEIFAKVKTLGSRDWQLEETGVGIVEIDRQRLTQVIINLADNAVRHTQPGGRIAIGSRLSGGELRMWVEDSGPGIPWHETERIFQRFTRIGGARRMPGTAGLGLAIVQAIVKAHGGRVEVASEQGKGSVFTVIIPEQGEVA
jgi:two-component system OmpR family sensor kinase